ncbi:hypothetical protein M8C21_014883 [Ambrosia artemisiifolia]|uniref:Uncharacterized protein n=1 Tax=Ambrosia artemisiifolia TaxID=4212 RepID=A0AAD5D658_AMBAR|nr:hypothetical protein M8C21_014883 [Ambrosia artemisiifolia]
MMPIGTPRVPYRVPGEGTWQWVDLWNALVYKDLSRTKRFNAQEALDYGLLTE